jgi:hypothetical protein
LSLIEINEYSTDIKMILNDEITDSQCKCYTGRMSRLINCLNGYMDKVEIKISDTEQIGYVINAVELELLNRQYNIDIIEQWIVHIE